MRYDLRPCPFCGSDKVGIHKRRGRKSHATGFQSYREYVYCKSCGGRTTVAARPGNAVPKWNRRPEVPA